MNVSPPDGGSWRLLAREPLCDTPHLDVAWETVATPSRPGGVPWIVAHRRIAAVVAPRTPRGTYLLIRQERIPIRRALWEFPAGQADDGADGLEETARRELGEETGAECRGELVPLGFYFTSAGFTDECCHLFLATDVVPRAAGAHHDGDEAILDVGEFSPAELRRLIAEGGIMDANTLATFARLEARGLFA